MRERNTKPIILGVSVVMVSTMAVVGALMLPGGAGAGRSDKAPKSPESGFTLAGPDGEPLRDKCGDVVRATQEEMFAAMDELGESDPAPVTQAQLDQQALEEEILHGAITEALQDMKVVDLDEARELLQDPGHPRQEEFRQRLDALVEKAQRGAGLPVTGLAEEPPPGDREASLDAAAAMEPNRTRQATAELFDHVVEDQNRSVDC